MKRIDREWENDSEVLVSNDFEHDVILRIYGDFYNKEEFQKYKAELCELLNMKDMIYHYYDILGLEVTNNVSEMLDKILIESLDNKLRPKYE